MVAYLFETSEKIDYFYAINCAMHRAFANVLNGHIQLWDRGNLDMLKRVHPNLKSKYIYMKNSGSIFAALLGFQSYTEKPIFECAFAHL